MDYLIVDYLISEGYVNSESSALKIIDVISEGFYEYLITEALTPEERAARRAEIKRRREENRIADPYNSRKGAQQDRPSSRGGELPTLGQRRRAEVANEILSRAPENPNRPHGKVASSRGSTLISQSDFSPLTKTFKSPKPGQKPSQTYNPNISSTIDVGPQVGREKSQRYSKDESDILTGKPKVNKKEESTTSLSSEKPPVERVRRLPPQRIPERKPTQQTSPQPKTRKTPSQAASSSARKIVGIIRKDPNK